MLLSVIKEAIQSIFLERMKQINVLMKPSECFANGQNCNVCFSANFLKCVKNQNTLPMC